MKTENTRSRAGIHIPEFRRSLPAVFFWGRRGGTGLSAGSGNRGERLREEVSVPRAGGNPLKRGTNIAK